MQTSQLSTLSARIPSTTVKRLRLLVALLSAEREHRVTVQDLVVEALQDLFAKHDARVLVARIEGADTPPVDRAAAAPHAGVNPPIKPTAPVTLPNVMQKKV